MICNKCGIENKEGAIFCQECGTKILNKEQVEIPEQEEKLESTEVISENDVEENDIDNTDLEIETEEKQSTDTALQNEYSNPDKQENERQNGFKNIFTRNSINIILGISIIAFITLFILNPSFYIELFKGIYEFFTIFFKGLNTLLSYIDLSSIESENLYTTLTILIPILIYGILLIILFFAIIKIGIRILLTSFLVIAILINLTTPIKPVNVISSELITPKDNEAITMTDAVLASSYFYISNDIPGKKNDQMYEYMTELTNENLNTANEIVKLVNKSQSDMNKLYESIIKITKNEDSIIDENLMRQILLYDEFYESMSINIASYDNIKITDTESYVFNSNLIAFKIETALKTGAYLDEAFLQLTGIALNIHNLNINNENSEINSELKSIVKMIDKTNNFKNINKVYTYSHIINETEKYIEIAKMEVALENLEYAKAEGLKTFDQLENLNTDNYPNLTPEMIDDIKLATNEASIIVAESIVAIEIAINEIEIDDSLAIKSINKNSLIIEVNASNGSTFGKIIDTKETLKKKELPKQEGSMFNFLKTKLNQALDTADEVICYTAKKVRNVINFTVESVDMAGGVGATIFNGLINGDDTEIIENDVKERIDQSVKNVMTNQAGTRFYGTGREYLKKTKELVEEGYDNIGSIADTLAYDTYQLITTGEIDKTKVPPKMISSVLSTIGGLASNSLLKIGTGVTKIMDPNSSLEEINGGMLHIASGFATIGSAHIGIVPPHISVQLGITDFLNTDNNLEKAKSYYDQALNEFNSMFYDNLENDIKKITGDENSTANDYYKKLSNQNMEQEIAPTVAKVENTPVEVALQTEIIDSSDYQYNVTLHVFDNSNYDETTGTYYEFENGKVDPNFPNQIEYVDYKIESISVPYNVSTNVMSFNDGDTVKIKIGAPGFETADFEWMTENNNLLIDDPTIDVYLEPIPNQHIIQIYLADVYTSDEIKDFTVTTNAQFNTHTHYLTFSPNEPLNITIDAPGYKEIVGKYMIGNTANIDVETLQANIIPTSVTDCKNSRGSQTICSINWSAIPSENSGEDTTPTEAINNNSLDGTWYGTAEVEKIEAQGVTLGATEKALLVTQLNMMLTEFDAHTSTVYFNTTNGKTSVTFDDDPEVYYPDIKGTEIYFYETNSQSENGLNANSTANYVGTINDSYDHIDVVGLADIGFSKEDLGLNFDLDVYIKMQLDKIK